jgi:hypothetical protein
MGTSPTRGKLLGSQRCNPARTPAHHDIEPRRPARYPQPALLAWETRRAEGVSTVATVPSSVRFISRHGLWTPHHRTVLPDEYDVAR